MINVAWSPAEVWTDRKFIRYVARHAREPQALWSPAQIARLVEFAGVEIPVHPRGVWVVASQPSDLRTAVLRARARLGSPDSAQKES